MGHNKVLSTTFIRLIQTILNGEIQCPSCDYTSQVLHKELLMLGLDGTNIIKKDPYYVKWLIKYYRVNII